MGNCLRNNKISAQDHENYETSVEAKIKTSSSCKLEASRRQQSMKKVSFKLHNDIDEGIHNRGCHGNSTSGAVRIRLVMTREELKRMLSCKNDAQQNSLEQLLSAVKLRRGRIHEVNEYDGGINSWKPALESIPEEKA